MTIRMDEGGRIIRSIFPGAEKDDGTALFDKNQYKEGAEAFRVGKHFILLHTDLTSHVARVEWKAGGRWRWNVEAAKRLDAYRPRTEADLIGWLSYIWESIAQLAQQTLIGMMDPADLFPDGYQGHHNDAMIRGALEVLRQCGKAPQEIIRYVADDMTVKWMFNHTDDTTKPVSMLFKVNGAVEGNVVGRIHNRFMGEQPFQWAYRIMVGTDTLSRKGEITFRGSDDTFIERAQKLLKRLYIKAIFDHLRLSEDPVKVSPRAIAP